MYVTFRLAKPIKTGFYYAHVNVISREGALNYEGYMLKDTLYYIRLYIESLDAYIDIYTKDALYNVLYKYRGKDIRIHLYRCNQEEYPYRAFGLTIVD